ncbi:MAG: hypothetical protein AAFR71_16755 [Pseudomonadota bacterium]
MAVVSKEKREWTDSNGKRRYQITEEHSSGYVKTTTGTKVGDPSIGLGWATTDSVTHGKVTRS